jgi:hypothetical protein
MVLVVKLNKCVFFLHRKVVRRKELGKEHDKEGGETKATLMRDHRGGWGGLNGVKTKKGRLMQTHRESYIP